MAFYSLNGENSGPLPSSWQPEYQKLGLYPSLGKILGNLTHRLHPSPPPAQKDLRIITAEDSPKKVALPDPPLLKLTVYKPHICVMSHLSRRTTISHFKSHLNFKNSVL